MSEPKRASLITVDDGKKNKVKVPRTIRLIVDLPESNENEYPQFSYRELVKAEETRLKDESRAGVAANGTKSADSDPFSENDDDVERIAKQFEQKYGGSNTYGKRKNVTKNDDFADIGAGYDENDSFIDNTDGYDEMIPPEFDTAYGGFYINSGCLEFKNVPDSALTSDRASESDAPTSQKKGSKRRLSTSESNDSSSDSSGAETDSSVQLDSGKPDNAGSENNTDCNKSSNDTGKKMKSKIQSTKKRRKESSDAPPETGPEVVASGLPGSQPVAGHHSNTTTKTVRELLDARNVREPGFANQESHANTENIPSSDTAASSDSSCGPSGVRNNEVTLPSPVISVLAKVQLAISSNGGIPLTTKQLDNHLLEMETYLIKSGGGVAVRRAAYNECAILCGTSTTPMSQRPKRAALQQRGRKLYTHKMNVAKEREGNSGEKRSEMLTNRLRSIIDEIKPSIIANYKAECKKIEETNKQIASQNAAIVADDKKVPERRLPKRRYPWNEEVRSLLEELAKIQGEVGSSSGTLSKEEVAAIYLRDKVLPLFPQGFVRLPTLLQQASLNKNQKIPSDAMGKRGPKPAEYKQNAAAMLAAKAAAAKSQLIPDQKMLQAQNSLSEALKQKSNAELLSAMNFPSNSQITIEKTNKTEIDGKWISGLNSALTEKPSSNMPNSIRNDITEKYNPPNSIGSITITPVNTSAPKVDIKQQASRLSNNMVTITTSPPKTEQISPNSEQKQIRVKSVTALYDKNVLAKIISSNNSEEHNKVYDANTDEYSEKANGVMRDKFLRLDSYSISDSYVSAKDVSKYTAETNVLRTKSPSVSQMESVRDIAKDRINKPPLMTKSNPDMLRSEVDVRPFKPERAVGQSMSNANPDKSFNATTKQYKENTLDFQSTQRTKSLSVTQIESVREVTKNRIDKPPLDMLGSEIDVRPFKPERAGSPVIKNSQSMSNTNLDKSFNSAIIQYKENNLEFLSSQRTKSSSVPQIESAREVTKDRIDKPLLTAKSNPDMLRIPEVRASNPNIKTMQNITNPKSDRSFNTAIKQPKENNVDFQLALKLAIPTNSERTEPPKVTTPTGTPPNSLKSHRIAKKPRETTVDLEAEVPITGSVIIKPVIRNVPNATVFPPGDRAQKECLPFDDSSSDVELIEVPDDPLNIASVPCRADVSRSRSNTLEGQPYDKLTDKNTNNDTSFSDATLATVDPSERYSFSDQRLKHTEDVSKHSSDINNSDKVVSSSKDEPNLDSSEVDIHSVMQGLKELTNFHDSSNGGHTNRFYKENVHNKNAYIQDSNVFSNTALKKTDTTPISDLNHTLGHNQGNPQ